MLGNDLDNRLGPRTLVHVSAVFEGELSINKVLKVIPTFTKEYTPHMLRVADYARQANRGVRFVLFAYENDGYPAESMYDALDGISHPFNNLLIFKDAGHLSDYILVNQDVKHIIDPLHPGRFGSWSA